MSFLKRTEDRLKNIPVQYRVTAALLAAFTVFRLILAVRLPMCVWANKHDDLLLAQYADSISRGEWLGEYNNLTLVKGVSYSLFLAFCNVAGLNYSLALCLFYIISVLVFIAGIRSIFRSFYCGSILYLTLLFGPVMLADEIVRRCYRMAVIAPALLLLTGCLWGMFLRRHKGLRHILPWSIGAGVSLSYFWYIREDSVWILPFCAAASAISVICACLKERHISRKLLARILVFMLPLLMLGGGTLALCSVNYKYYGVFTANDRNGTWFAKMTSDMLKVKSEKNSRSVWVSRDAFEKMMRECPSLEGMREEILWMYGENSWGNGGEISEDIFIWAFRDAMDRAGYYKTAQTANQFCRQVYNELEQAFAEGRLEKQDAVYLSSMVRGIKKDEIPALAADFLKITESTASYHLTAGIRYSYGTAEEIRFMTELFHQKTVTPLMFEGWAFSKKENGEVKLILTNEDTGKTQVVKPEESPDVQEAFPEYAGAGAARYSVTAENQGTWSLKLYIGGQEVPLESAENEDYAVRVDEYLPGYSTAAAEKDGVSVDIANGIMDLYRVSAPVIKILAGICWIVLLCRSVCILKDARKKRKVSGKAAAESGVFETPHVWLVTTGLILSAMICAFALACFLNGEGSALVNAAAFYGIGASVIWQTVQAVLILYTLAGFLTKTKLAGTGSKQAAKNGTPGEPHIENRQ